MNITKKLSALTIPAVIIVSATFLMGFLPEEDIIEYDGVEYAEEFEYGGDPIQFESFKISTNYMDSESYCYEGYTTEDGVHLEHYLSRTHWDDNNKTEERTTVHAIEGKQELYDELCALLGNCRIDKWNGFHGSNPPDVWDGSTMEFEAVLSDGTLISSSGSNNFPSNYGTFTSALHDLTCIQEITDTLFDNGDYKIKIPESWIGTVSANYSSEYTAFSVNKTNGEKISFFIIDDCEDGYNSSENRLGRLLPVISEESFPPENGNNRNERYINARSLYLLEGYKDSLGEAEKRIAEDYEEDFKAIVESLVPAEGFTFIPEDGTILYYSDARSLYSSASSLWLYAFVRAEYSVYEEPVKINGRNYLLIYPLYFGEATPEGVRNQFLKYFTEEFTDRIISQAEATKDMVVKDGHVYVSCRVFDDDHVYFNSWVDSVENNNDGSFDVIVKATKTVENKNHETEYIDDIFHFPARQNENGKFVFTDFPYWEKTVEK